MPKLHQTILTALTLLVATTACRGGEDEDEATGEVQQEGEEEEGLPDLPCGGADLMTDNHNCGTCGHECPIWYEGTEWEAGTCKDGECGPTWFGCWTEFAGPNCEEICEAGGLTCVANGCSGFTALLTAVGFDANGDLSNLYGTMSGSCDEPIPWMSTIEWSIHADCCCK